MSQAIVGLARVRSIERAGPLSIEHNRARKDYGRKCFCKRRLLRKRGDEMIQFPCPSCGKPLKVPEGAAGKTGMCLHCKQIVEVPLKSAEPAITEPLASASAVAVTSESAPPREPERFVVLRPRVGCI